MMKTQYLRTIFNGISVPFFCAKLSLLTQVRTLYNDFLKP